MPYLLKSKGRPFRVRDGVGPAAPMYIVGAEWVPFDHLPLFVSVHGDGDLDVREVKSLDGVKKPSPFIKPNQKQAIKQEAEDPAPAQAPEKQRRDGRATLSGKSDKKE